MKRTGYPLRVSLLLAVSISMTAYGFADVTALHPREDSSHCFGLAMVGMDSVINSRLGIFPEHILHLATIDPRAAIASPDEVSAADTYSARLLKIIYEAYLWTGEPHEYASQVLDTCTA